MLTAVGAHRVLLKSVHRCQFVERRREQMRIVFIDATLETEQ